MCLPKLPWRRLAKWPQTPCRRHLRGGPAGKLCHWRPPKYGSLGESATRNPAKMTVESSSLHRECRSCPDRSRSRTRKSRPPCPVRPPEVPLPKSMSHSVRRSQRHPCQPQRPACRSNSSCRSCRSCRRRSCTTTCLLATETSWRSTPCPRPGAPRPQAHRRPPRKHHPCPPLSAPAPRTPCKSSMRPRRAGASGAAALP
mmetsp:Transcript_152707/g.489828  ORF Transcript_152707/g.489828 Transcript_152707/m.489828 type:complete len:200 (-) Transcript_152707:987-1586(-)